MQVAADAAIKAGLTAAEIATAADAFADGNADNQFPIGMRRFLEPMTIREWLAKSATESKSAPTSTDAAAERIRQKFREEMARPAEVPA